MAPVMGRRAVSGWWKWISRFPWQGPSGGTRCHRGFHHGVSRAASNTELCFDYHPTGTEFSAWCEKLESYLSYLESWNIQCLMYDATERVKCGWLYVSSRTNSDFSGNYSLFPARPVRFPDVSVMPDL